MYKPFSQACENNREPIRQVLDEYLKSPAALLEIGSGTGQHGAYITSHYPELVWYCSDVEENLAGIECWVQDAGNPNFISPFALNINQATWAKAQVDFVYSANTAHIMSWLEVEKLLAFIPTCLKPEGLFFLYGPFNYEGSYTSQSNEQFDYWLKTQAPHRGIRDFEAINNLARAQGLTLVNDHAMPANNRLLVWTLSR